MTEIRDPAAQAPFDLVKHAVFPVDMFYVAVMVDEQVARDLLLYNREPEVGQSSTNRKASKVLVDGYAANMLKGEWYLSPQPIVLSSADRSSMTPEEIEELMDGQQRLKAVVQAARVQPDIAVPFIICFDAPSAAKWWLDMGKKRQPGDFFRMQGEANPGQLANAVRLLYPILELQPFKSIGIWRAVSLTPQEQTIFLAKHASLRQGLEVARSMKTLVMPHVGAVLFYMIASEYNVWVAQKFFDGLVSGANLSVTDPRLIAREFIAVKSNPQRGPRHKWDGFELLALLISAANAWLLGDDGYKAGLTFNKMSKHFPHLIKRDQMPQTRIVPGNDPNLGS